MKTTIFISLIISILIIYRLIMFSWVATKYTNNLTSVGQSKIHSTESKKSDKKINFSPDTAINCISLNNSISDKCLYTIMKISKFKGNRKPGLQTIEFQTKNREQRLTLYHHPGCDKYEFSEFKVEYNYHIDSLLPTIQDNNLITESKIKLGITFKKLESIKGKPDILKLYPGIQIYTYKINNFTTSSFLKKYNLPKYYAEYKFLNGYLVEFKFGFENP